LAQTQSQTPNRKQNQNLAQTNANKSVQIPRRLPAISEHSHNTLFDLAYICIFIPKHMANWLLLRLILPTHFSAALGSLRYLFHLYCHIKIASFHPRFANRIWQPEDFIYLLEVDGLFVFPVCQISVVRVAQWGVTLNLRTHKACFLRSSVFHTNLWYIYYCEIRN